ncbi:MAG: 3-hydroxybutyryl-CoA dehydrogenase [Deltaproteobacteria bacterium]|nr:3-hydroxybutyryl-CoA dehydrogenase [Deltaproteobacteria bacterium]
MNITTIGVIGSGQMGSGIAQVFAVAGYNVIMHDVEASRVEKGKSSIEKSLTKFVEKGKLSPADRDAAMSRLTGVTSLESLKTADLIIEAATEDLNLKLKIFSALDEFAKPGAILASNTSSLPITTLAQSTNRPEQVIGMHFMNPVPLMKGVEVIRGIQTDDATAQTISTLIAKLGKSEVRSRDVAGFVANRILMPMIREAILALEQQVSSRDHIDRCMVDCCNFPLGPLALADMIGLDTCASIMNVMADGLGSEYYKPPKLLTQMVAEGKLGKKTKKGFYDY